MLTLAQIRHGKDGYHLYIVQTPLWAYTAERAGEWLCDATGDRLCGAGLPGRAWKVGAGRGEDGDRRWSISTAAFSFGQWLHTISARRERTITSIPLGVEFVAEHFPDKRMEFLEQ